MTVALLALRLKALRRAVRDHAATLFILFPLVFGTGLLLLVRVVGDLGERVGTPQWWEAGAWVMATLAAWMLVRRRQRRHAMDLVACLPLTPLTRRVDGFLSALVRLLPLGAVLAAVLMATGAAGSHWLGLLLLIGLMPLLAVVSSVPAGGARRHRLDLASLVAWMIPWPYRPLARRDLVLIMRGGAPGTGIYLSLATVALVAAVANAAEAALRPAVAALALSAWALSATVSALLIRQWRQLWLEVDAGVAPDRLWRAKVAVAAVLGLVPGLIVGGVWLPNGVLAAALFPLTGLGVGVVVGAALMEGDGNPALHGVVSLLLAFAVAVGAMLSPLALMAVPFVAGYLERLGVPRLARRMDEVAASA